MKKDLNQLLREHSDVYHTPIEVLGEMSSDSSIINPPYERYA